LADGRCGSACFLWCSREARSCCSGSLAANRRG
jgi:hypothetical protein